ncbi:MAG: glyoxalase [Mycobacterium sp.]|nr:glyoxalase [Mycobacterium sp.]
MIKALNELEVITLFVEDLPAVKTFYTNVFGLELISEDDESAVLKLKNVMINLLVAFEAHDLIAPVSVAAESIGVRSLLTVNVTDAYAVISDLEQHGVKMINGPVDQPWGRRTGPGVKRAPGSHSPLHLAASDSFPATNRSIHVEVAVTSLPTAPRSIHTGFINDRNGDDGKPQRCGTGGPRRAARGNNRDIECRWPTAVVGHIRQA